MRRKKRPFWSLVLSLLSLVSLLYLSFSFPPNYLFRIMNYELGIMVFFFMLIFLFCFSLFAFLFNNNRRGLFIGLFVVSYLLLRLNHLTQSFFLIILFFLFVTLELVFRKPS